MGRGISPVRRHWPKSAAALRVAAVLALSVPGLVGAPTPARSAEDLQLLPSAPSVKSIHVVGVQSLDRGDLEKLVTIKTPDLLHPFRRPRFYRGLVQQDAQTLENWSRAQGFARAEVVWDTVSVEGGVDLYFRVDEGEPIRVVATELRGLDEQDRARLARRLSLQAERPYTVTGLDADRQRIEQYLADRGHPFARIIPYAEVGLDRAVVVHRIDPGPLTTIDAVTMAGSGDLNERALRRELTVRSGDLYSNRQLDRSRQRLYDTGFFRDVEVGYPLDGIDTLANTVDVEFRLTQRKLDWVGAGIGFTSDGLLRLTGEWGTRSIFGTGRALRLAVRTARQTFGERPFFYRRENYAQASLTERWLFGTRIRGQLQGFYHFDNVRNEFVRQEILGAGAQVSYELKERRNSVALILEGRRTFNEIESDSIRTIACEEDPILCEERYAVRSITGRLTFDERDDFLNPTRGYRHEVQLENAGGWFGGDSNFLKALDNSMWLSRRAPGSVLAARVRVGAINPGPSDIIGRSGTQVSEDAASVPFEERFFVGGAGSVRGYQEGTLNGLQDGKDPTGGGVLEILANAEWRFTIRGPLGGVLFLDAGNVWRDAGLLELRHVVPTFDRNATEPGHLRYSIGGGIRINSPVGPIRLEGAWRLSPARFEYPSDIHLAVGQAF